MAAVSETQTRDLSQGYTVPEYLKPFVERALASAPPLSNQQINQIASVLRPVVAARAGRTAAA